MKQVFAFTGLKGSGKDTAAKYILDGKFDDSVLIKFADPLKNMIRTLLTEAGFNPDQIEDMVEGNLKEMPIMEFGGRSCRYLMQTLGTEWGREKVCDSLWIDITLNKIANSPKPIIVVTDLRFANELEAMRSVDAIIHRIERGTVVDKDMHPSETFVMEMDVPVIKNDGTIEDLHNKIKEMVIETIG